MVAACSLALAGIGWLDPVADDELLLHVTELAVVLALFATGLRLDRPLGARPWATVARLLGIAMPITIAAVALLGSALLGLSAGAAIVLGAVLAPTDPVLAGDVGVGPPGEDEEEAEPNFSITAEAGLNDGLAFPFVLLGLVLAGDATSLGEWAAADVAYAIVAGIVLGALAGHLLARAIVPLRERDLLLDRLDVWLGAGAVLLVYGAIELVGAYGFLGVFAAGLAFRRFEREHHLNRRIHDGAELMEKFGELAVILLLGSMLTTAGLALPGVAGWVLVVLLLVVVRPAAVAVALVRTRLPAKERLWVAWFGVRGIGSLFYAAVAVGSGALAREDAALITWVAIAAVLASVVAHGVTAVPLERRLLGREIGGR